MIYIVFVIYNIQQNYNRQGTKLYIAAGHIKILQVFLNDIYFHQILTIGEIIILYSNLFCNSYQH